MRLYHGTNTDLLEADLAKSFPPKDSGQGFYSTTMCEQTERMAKRRQQTLGGKAIMQECEFEESALRKGDLKVLTFEGTTPEWTTFIFNNRSGNKNYQHDHDIVVGLIADGGAALLTNLYITGAVTLAQFTRMLEFKKLSNQYFSGAKEVVKLLRRIE